MAVQPPRFGDDPAPVLPSLHRAQAEDGRLTRPALEELAATLALPLVDLYDTASFYHYFGLGDTEPITRGRCVGPACSIQDGSTNGETNGSPIPCPGLCDQPIAFYENGRFAPSLGGVGGYTHPHHVDSEEVLYKDVRTPQIAKLDVYRAQGGYRQLERLLQGEIKVDEALETLAASGLTGRGGAAFPIAAKWRAAQAANADVKYVICNADEGEPGTFKDRPILYLQPHLLLESMAIAGYVVGATVGIIYLRFEYPEAMDILEGAIREAEEAGLLGSDAGGNGFTFNVHVRRGAGSYVCGEETALLNSLEGRKPWPRERPPFPTDSGLWGKPTVINNVETLCNVPWILENGADRFQALGRGDNAGTKVYSVSGKVQRPGNFELPMGVTAREVIEGQAGGAAPGHTVKAFTLGGVSGGLLSADHLDMALDNTAPREFGASLGSGGIVVLDDDSCVVDFVRTCLAFYQEESCGRCYPCRIGTTRLREIFDGITGRAPLAADALEQFEQIGEVMAVTSACGLGQAAPSIVTGMLQAFGPEVEAHLNGRSCPTGVCPL